MNTPPVKVGVIFLGRKRPGFDMQWGRTMDERVRRQLGQTGFSLFEPPEKAVDDASLRQALAACQAQRVDVLLLLQTTMADVRLVPTVAQLWANPLVLWATPENPQGEMISSCSLVGVHAWASILRQMGHPFDVVYGDPDDAATAKRIGEAVRLAATVGLLRRARVGVIGGQAPGYFAMHADLFSLQRGLGVQLQLFTLVEFAAVVESFSKQQVAEDVARVKALGFPHKDTTDDDLPMASRLYLAMRHYLDNEKIDALSVRCWPEMGNTMFNQWPYLGMARLVEEGRAVACEGDADGALTALVGESLGMGRAYLSDWLEHDDETITLWHGGAAPPSLSPPPGEPGSPRIARHFNIKKPAVLDATLRENMPVTICRLWRFDGKYLLTTRDADTIRPRRHLMGTNGLARLAGQNPREWFDVVCYEGMPHHVVVFPGHHSAKLQQLAKLLGIRAV
jgi:L-fucose isomerase-like protein